MTAVDDPHPDAVAALSSPPERPSDDSAPAHVDQLAADGTAKGPETVVVSVTPAEGDRGPRFLLAGEGEREKAGEPKPPDEFKSPNVG